MATAKVRSRQDSSSSSSTESVNSIPISDDEDAMPPIVLDSKSCKKTGPKSEKTSDRKSSDKKSEENGAKKKIKKKPPPRPSAPPPPEVIQKIVATNSVDIDDKCVYSPNQMSIPEKPVILASPSPKLKNRGIPPIPENPSPDTKKSDAKTDPDLVDEGAGLEDQSSTPRWRKLVDTSSGIWQTSTAKLSSSKVNVSNKFSSVVLLAKKASSQSALIFK